MPKRTDYISRDDYFMGVALLSAHRSKDPLTQVGACLVNKDNVILGTGYNGLPKGCSDEEFPWDKDPEILSNKHTYVVHAEANAILNANGNVVGSKLYVALFPCNECAKLIIQSGVQQIVYLSDSKAERGEYQASKRMLDAAGVRYTQFTATTPSINLSFDI